MPTWDPTTYLTFSDERGRPFRELVARVETSPRTIVDLGCGPGHLMSVLRERWPDSRIVGLDSSPEMIRQARTEHALDGVDYTLGDIADWAPPSPVDLVISNAALQWLPDQLSVARRLRAFVSQGGALAIQVPNSFTEPRHTLLRELAERADYAPYLAGTVRAVDVTPQEYLEALAAPGWRIDAWETTYLHVLPGEDPVFAWMSGTGARPALEALPDPLRAGFAAEYRAALRRVHEPRPYGTVLPFRRTFVVATREDPR